MTALKSWRSRQSPASSAKRSQEQIVLTVVAEAGPHHSCIVQLAILPNGFDSFYSNIYNLSSVSQNLHGMK